jgi:hypothetical protein
MKPVSENLNNQYVYDNRFLKTLSDLYVQKSPADICIFLGNNLPNVTRTSNILATLGQNDSNESTIKLMSLIDKALECNALRTSFYETFLREFIESDFFCKNCIHCVKSMNLRMLNQNPRLIKLLLKICFQILSHYEYNFAKIDSLLDQLDQQVRSSYDKDLFEYYSLSMKSLNQLKESSSSRSSIVPRLDEIFNDRNPKLEKNIIKGAYQDSQHYLEVQYKLLREDFLQPLRDGIVKFREIVYDWRRNCDKSNNIRFTSETFHEMSRIDSLFVYHDVEMNSNECNDHGVVYSMRLNQASVSAIKWELSKRLIFGSLVCLSSDYFETDCLIGIICDRDPALIQREGIIFVKFDYDPKSNNLPMPNKTYTMLETTAFFESYRHVLHALSSFQRDVKIGNALPFENELVFGDYSSNSVPKYLQNSIVDFRVLVDKDKKVQFNERTKNYAYSFTQSNHYARNCRIDKPWTWPTAEQMNLDESQYDAIKLAMSNKLALIQGYGLKLFLNFSVFFSTS